MTDKNKQAMEQDRSEESRSRRKLLSGAACASALAMWHMPVINAIVLPAHAQTSVPEPTPPTAAEVCPMVVVQNAVFGPVSGTNTPPVCTVTFDVLSADATQDLTIQSITTGTLPADVTVDVQDLGTATATTGARVVWRGPASDAPFCSDLMPTDEVTFTVTATCAAATLGDSFTQSFTLSSIL